jgi:hypothetical protein
MYSIFIDIFRLNNTIYLSVRRNVMAFSCFLFVFCSSTSAVFTAVLIMSSMIPLTILSLDTDETQELKNRIFRSILALRDIHFTCILRLLNNTCVKHYFKSVHVSNLFWSREYNSAKEICNYHHFQKYFVVFTLYNRLITFSCFLFVFCSSTSAVFTAVLIMSSMIPLTILSHFINKHDTIVSN